MRTPANYLARLLTLGIACLALFVGMVPARAATPSDQVVASGPDTAGKRHRTNKRHHPHRRSARKNKGADKTGEKQGRRGHQTNRRSKRHRSRKHHHHEGRRLFLRHQALLR